MKRSPALVAIGSGLLLAASLPASQGAVAAQDDSVVSQATALGFTEDKSSVEKAPRPKGANPYLALLPRPERVDWAAWNAYLDRVGDRRDARRERMGAREGARQRVRPPVLVDEEEPNGTRGSNDTYQTAQRIPQFGTSRNPRARILGQLDNEQVVVEAQPPSTEDDGSITLARDTEVGDALDGFSTTGAIGDGPHGSAGSGSGDFDVYSVHGTAGEVITVDTNTPTGNLDSMVSLLDSTGALVAFNDDDGSSLDSVVTFKVPADGDYYAFVHGFPNFPGDPFDSGSGDGAGTEGPYEVKITQAEVDVDVYGVRLEVGDVLGLSVTGGANLLGILDGDGDLVHGSNQDASFIYPLETPLPGGGNAVNEHVADEDGWHYIAVESGSGTYDVTAEAYRPGLEGDPPRQTIYLDFDGERVNTGIWGGPGVRDLSPLRAFLGRWGLTNADYQPLVRRIERTARENLIRDMRASGVNPDFRLVVRDGRDTFGEKPNVSRLVVGGTIEESGIPTIGIAESIDPGNYGHEETALILLDVLSGSPDEWGDASLNFYITPASDKVKFIGTAIGNVASHEAGHYLGDWHVDQFNDVLNIMDQGGNFPLLYGVGPDMIGGTADDPDVDFGEDEFNPNEGFLGIEDTLSRVAAVLTQ